MTAYMNTIVLVNVRDLSISRQIFNKKNITIGTFDYLGKYNPISFADIS